MSLYLFFSLQFLLSFTLSQPSIITPDPSPPAYAPDGRLALAIDGDIWVLTIKQANSDSFDLTLENAEWTQLTKGSAEDRDPVWGPDSRSLVFASDRSGNFELWQVEPGKETQQLTHSSAADTQPAFAYDGSLVWVRGSGADANLWLKRPGAQEQQLTTKLGAETNPKPKPYSIASSGEDDLEIAFVVHHKNRHELHVLSLKDSSDTLIPTQPSPEFPSWSPDGQRLVYTTRGNNPGVWITDREGEYHQPISTRRAAATWSPVHERLALMALPRPAPAYNGDPSPSKGRPEMQAHLGASELFFLATPLPPDTGSVTLSLNPPLNRKEANLQRFDRVVHFLTTKYNLVNKASWKQLVEKQRQAAGAATNSEALEDAIYKVISERPLLRQEAIGKAAVSSAHPLATAAGLEIIKKGGNVVDAAVAVSFALGVVEPDASGVGGYGEMLVYLEGMKAPTCIEFLTRVPEAASLSNGALIPLPIGGPVLVNIPGTVAGMELAWKRYGSKKVEWADLLEPAIRLAEEGFVVDDGFATTLSREKEQYLKYESSRTLFFRDSFPLLPGDTLRNPDLAWTLTEIAKGGGAAFYGGTVAQRMVQDLRSHGNVMTLQDMARYYAVEREPVRTTYRGHSVYSGPPPVSGGALLLAKLNLLEGVKEPKSMQQDAATLHSMIEAWKLSPSTSGRIADPGLWPVDLHPFTDKTLAEERWQSCFDPLHSITPQDSSCMDNRVAASWGAEGILEARRSTGTTAFAIADGQGNMVAVTQTLGTWGGNFYVSPGLGFIYNDKLRSYGSNANRYNARIPFARNVTSIAPTMIFKLKKDEEEPLAALGAAGNAWITSAVYQMVTGIIDQNLGPQEAIEQPRFLVAVRRNRQDRKKVEEIVVQLEDGFAPGVPESLQYKGHILQFISARGELRMGYASAVMIEGDKVRAGADPRRSGEAGATN